MHRLRIAPGCCLLLLSAACGPSDDEVRPVVALQVPADTVVLEPAITIGLSDGDPDYLFGSITSVAADLQGRIYVGDGSAGTVRVYGQDGVFLRRIAGPGQGPGEVSGGPVDVSVGPDGRLYVQDDMRVSVFARTTPDGVPDSVVARWTALGWARSPARNRVSREGGYYYPAGSYPAGVHPRFFFPKLSDGTHDADSLEVPAYPNLVAHVPTRLRFGVDSRMLRGLSHVPFAPIPVWTVTPGGTLYSTDGSGVLLETSVEGDTIRRVVLPPGRVRAIPTRERADSLKALEARLSGIPVPLDKVEGLSPEVVQRRLPDAPPEVLDLYAGEDGTVWVERWPPDGEEASRHYDVLDEDGKLIQVVIVRVPMVRSPEPWIGRDVIVGVIRDPGTGVERVVRVERTRARRP